jgi:amino acid transporter
VLGNGFESMVIFTHPVFWFFFFLVGISLYVLRFTDPAAERPYRVIGYPVVPALFCVSCIWMFYSAVNYAISNRSYEALWSIAIIGLGFAIAFWPFGRQLKHD